MRIWRNYLNVASLNAMAADSIHAALDIRFTEVGDDFLEAEMPVDRRTHRPGGYLHGGASVVLAESVGSVASLMSIDPEQFDCFGATVYANHLKTARSGKIKARAVPIKIGKRMHVWQISIKNEANEEICLVQLTVAVVPKRD